MRMSALGNTKRATRKAVAHAVEALESRLLMSAWYVANNGSDSAAGSITAPLQTLQAAVADAKAGDTIILRGGTYNGGITISQPNITIQSYQGETAKIVAGTTSTSPQSNILFDINASGGKLLNLTITGGYYYAVKLNSNWDSGASSIYGASNILIQGCTISGAGDHDVKITPDCNHVTIDSCDISNPGVVFGAAATAECIDAVQANYLTISNNYLHDGPANACYSKGGGVNTIIENNRINNMGFSGIILGQSSDECWFDTTVNPNYYESINGIVRNNIITNVQGFGIGAWAALNPIIDNNTMINVGQSMFGGLLIQGQEHWPTAGPYAGQDIIVPSTNVTMENNIVVMAAGSTRPAVDIRANGLTGTLTMNNNRYYQSGGTPSFWDERTGFTGNLSQWQALGLDTTSSVGDPMLDSTNNYIPLAGSPVIDTGKTETVVTDDYFHHARPSGNAYDIGAVEYNATSITLTAPAAPTGLLATASSSSAIALSWTDNATNETGYYIQRSTDGTNYTQVGSVGAGVTSYSDSGLSASTKYYYRVCDYNAGGTSAYTNIASATTQAAPTQTTTTTQTIAWTNTAFTSQSGKFTATFTATPTVVNADIVMALTSGAATSYSSLAAAVRFNTSGTIDARNGSAYAAAATVTYSANTTYKFEFTVDTVGRTYSVYVTPAGGTRTLIASNYAFRSDSPTITAFNNFAKVTEVGDASVTGPTVAAVVNTTLTDVALGKNVTASATEASGNVASNLTDGNSSTRWASGGSVTSATVTIDLGTTYTISKVILNWENAYAKSYQIQTSLDGKTWTTVWSTTAGAGGKVTAQGFTTSARFVRVTMSKSAISWGFSLWDINVMGY